MKRINLFLLAFVAAFLFACKPEQPINPDTFTVGSGVLVLNEGNYQFSNASLTYYNPDADFLNSIVCFRYWKKSINTKMSHLEY